MRKSFVSYPVNEIEAFKDNILMTLQSVRGGGGFSAKFSGIIIFSMELYLGDQLCYKCIRKSFVSYPTNEIEAFKDNILMTLQSAIASAVRPPSPLG